MTGEPTLRYGDHEKDGWVRYLQEQVSIKLLEQDPHFTGEVPVDGAFGHKTLAAVRRFQALHHLEFEDGIVGDETWAALTNAAPHAPGTDGAQPHTHVDHGTHLVWNDQGGHEDGHWNADSDTVVWIATNVGDAAVPSNEHTASVSVTPASGTPHMEFMLLTAFTGTHGKPGEMFYVTWSGVKDTVGAGTHQYTLELPAELGGMQRQGDFTVT
jgi:hypothetical protein